MTQQETEQRTNQCDCKTSAYTVREDSKKANPNLLSNLTFGEAMELLKSGKYLTRDGWKNTIFCIFMQKGSYTPSEFNTDKVEVKVSRILSIPVDLFNKRDRDSIIANGVQIPIICAKLTGFQGFQTITGWTPNQIDMFAEDWRIINEYNG